MSEETKILRVLLIVVVGTLLAYGGYLLLSSASEQTGRQSQQLEDVSR